MQMAVAAMNTLMAGLMGRNWGTITASYATGAVNGDDGFDNVGGLVGFNEGPITASYASWRC